MIFHIVKRSEWDRARDRGVYSPATLDAEGFIHCSTREQILETASRFFAGVSGLVLLCIEEHRLTARLEYEAPVTPDDARRAERFPHIHGPLNLDSVARVVDFPCRPDGSFRLPAALREPTK